MGDEEFASDADSITPTTGSALSSQYLSTAILGVLIFIVLPVAYYIGGIQAAGLITILSLFLIVYFNQDGM
jgi:hypothetical protein